MRVILKPLCRCSLWIYLIPSSMSFIFRLLIILPVAKNNVSGYGVDKANAVNVHEVTAQGNFIVFIKVSIGKTCYYDRLHMMNLLQDRFPLQMWHTGSIYVLIYTEILSQNWEFMQEVIINCVQDLISWLACDVLESPCAIIPIYITDRGSSPN